MFKLKMKAQSGFTLVELMVVVAIIGILSAIAIPQFSTYQAKSRTSEAKLALAAIYSAEVAFQGEVNFFAQCLAQMGYRPSNQPAASTAAIMAQRYYNVGFGAAGALNAASTGAIVSQISACTAALANGVTLDNGYYGGSKGVAAATAPIGSVGVNATGNTFTAAASGQVDPGRGANTDRWTINQNKVLTHTLNGY